MIILVSCSITYDVKIHTIPSVTIKSVNLTVGKHTVMAADVPQGSMILITKDGHQYRDQQFLVQQAGKGTTLNVQKMYEEEKYLVGNYDIEIPILPRQYLNNVDISQSHTTKIEIPRPGILTVIKSSSGFGSLYLKKSNKDEEWVTNLNPKTKIESLVLQPGTYRVVFRAQNARQTLYTINKSVKIISGGSESVQLF